MKKIVVFTGAGISEESGLKTFRDAGGLWENYRIEEVATPEGWHRNPKMVLDFYNQRRKQIIHARPNAAHEAVARLQDKYDVEVITQNIDNLHERAGSRKILHLHGEIMKARSTADPNLVYDLNSEEIKYGDKCEKGSQLRPHIVWFGETVPEMEKAYFIAQKADIFIVIGSSLNVYPAAGVVDFAPANILKFLVDPADLSSFTTKDFIVIREKAGKGMTEIAKRLLEKNLP